jgi:RNA polymerase sigma factor (sigma-70 family)
MNADPDKTVDGTMVTLSSGVGVAARRRSGSSRIENWRRRSQKWGWLMVAAQRGEHQAYEQLLRELDVWLRRYYGRRLPQAAAEDARQEALLAIHAKRHAYAFSKPFGPWVATIARYKWIDQVRDAARFAALSLDDDIPSEDEVTISALVVADLLKQLKPAQANVIRLVKLQGLSVEYASRATGQSTALVKVNIHRGLKKLAALAGGDTTTPTTAGDSSERRNLSSNPNRSNGISTHQSRNLAATNERPFDGEESRIEATVGVSP